jgi:hypothetical protein
MASNQIYGWFDDAEQRVPSYDPPHDAPCLYCGNQIKEGDVRTHSLMSSGPVYAKRSYFYRTHRTCDDNNKDGIDGRVLDMITRNGD